MKTRYKTLLILCSIILSHSVYGQTLKFSKSSIKVGMGLGYSEGKETYGFGFVYTVGFLREIRKDRLRLNPNFSIGHYIPKCITDSPDQYFNSINIETNLFYDLIKVKSFSIVVGCGGFANNTKGLTGTGGFGENNNPPNSEYINKFHFGGYLGGGIRINNSKKRTAINILPINIHYGNNRFIESHAKIEFDFKF